MTTPFLPSIAELSVMATAQIQAHFTNAADLVRSLEERLLVANSVLEQARHAYAVAESGQQEAITESDHLKSKLDGAYADLRVERSQSIPSLVEQILNTELEGEFDLDCLDMEEVRERIASFLRDAIQEEEDWITPEQEFAFITEWTVRGKILVTAKSAREAESKAENVNLEAVTWQRLSQDGSVDVETDSIEHEETMQDDY